MNGEYLLYLQEIKDTEWVIELISEQFDDAMNMMTKNSVIYGGAVRDCLAGKDLIGDLDIAVSASESTTMINKFVKNPKWVNVSNNNKRSESHYKKFSLTHSFFGEPSRKSVFQTAPQIMTFKTLGNKTVQIIILSPTDDDPFQTVTTMVKQVDIVCCGVILTNDNKVFEVVPNAYKDCKKHVLHLNNACYVKDIENFKQRIEKLSERGWINEININKVIRTVNRKRKQKIENEKILAGTTKRTSTDLENHTHTIERSDFVDSNDKDTIMENGYIILRGPYTPQEGATGKEVKYLYADGTDLLSHTGYRSILSSGDIAHIGGLSDALYSLDTVAKKYRLDMLVQPVKNYLILITKNKYISNQVHDRVMGPAIPPITNKKLDGALHMYTETANLPMKKKYKLSASKTAYDHPEVSTMTYGQLEAQVPEIGKSSRPPILFKGVSKRALSDLNRKKELSKSGAPLVERYFNYSTDTESEATTTTIDRYYQRVSRGDIVRIGGIAMVLSRLERLAKRHKLDVGVIMENGTATIITRDDYTSKHVYKLLIVGNKEPLKANTKSSGGTIRWR